MQFEVTNKHEERRGMVFKKPHFLATVRIHLTDEEFDALKSMVSDKRWKMEPLGQITFGETQRANVTMEAFYVGVKKTKSFQKQIGTAMPEEREHQIREMQDIASVLKAILDTRLSALSGSDEDTTIEI